MRSLPFALALVLFTLPLRAEEAPPNQLTAQEKADGWKLLFDGKDASASWRGYRKEAMPDGWVVEDGTITRKTGGGDIITKDEYESFELSLEWKIAEGGNSGLMFKVKEDPKAPSYASGPEAQILDNAKAKESQKAGWLYQLYSTEEDSSKPAGEWNLFVLKCQKTPAGTYKCEHWLNGKKYVQYEVGSAEWTEKVAKSKFKGMPNFGKAAEGHLCLQDHGNVVSFRSIKIKVLP